MPRPSYGYTLANERPVPGVTTIIGRFDDKQFLIEWANKMGLKGISTKEVREQAFKDGKEIHHVFENVIKRRKVDVRPEHEKFVKKFTTVLQELEIVDVLSEIALVSEDHKFGGTPDLIVKTIKDENVIVDFKFANFVGVSLAYQMGAYKILAMENLRRNVTRAIGVHLEKKKFAKGETSIRLVEFSESALDYFAEKFLELRRMYDVVKEAEQAFEEAEIRFV